MGFLKKIKGYTVSVGNFWIQNVADLNPFYPAILVLNKVVQVYTPSVSKAINAVIASVLKYAYIDDVADLISRTTATISSTVAKLVHTPEATFTKSPATLGREAGLQMQVVGAVLDDGGVLTDYTTAMNNGTANDVNLLPAVPAVNDAFYIGGISSAALLKWERVWLNQGTAGAGNWSTVEEYWNGASWAACTIVKDTISSFVGGTGMREFRHTPQADWQTNAVNGITAYWIRFRVSAYVSVTTQPKGTQGWVEKIL